MSLILSGTDGLSDVDGSAATPAIRGTDANTGIFFPAADTIAFSEGGVESMRIDSSGNVGIGTSSPSTYGKFVVNGSSNTDAGIFIGNQSLTGSAPTYKGTVRIIDNPTSATGASGGLEFLTSSFGSGYGWKMAAIDSSGVQLTFATRQNSASWTEAMRINSDGNLLIGKTTTDSATNGIVWGAGVGNVVYAGGAGDGPQVQIVNTTAAATVPNGFRWLSFRIGSSATEIGKIEKTSSTTVAYVTSSDYRLKENVIPLTGALQRIANLRPVQWDWKGQADGGEGFIAHELAEFCPQAVTGKKDAMEADGVTPRYQGIDTSFLVATLTAAIQEQQALITALTARITALETP